MNPQSFFLVSIIAAILTIALKTLAWWVTGSVGLLSDALESFVNLAGATFALWMVTVAKRPADVEHPFGHSKAEYFSSGFEGILILGAAAAIIFAAVQRLLAPQPLEAVTAGLWFSAASTLINFLVAQSLRRAAARFRSIALEADSKHLMTDVWTSLGVIVGVFAVRATGWLWLDPLVAIGVALHIVAEGGRLVYASVNGLMDHALPREEVLRIESVLKSFAARGVRFRNLRTRLAGAEGFVAVDILVPGDWQVRDAHDVLDEIEASIRDGKDHVSVMTHLEPVPLESRGSR